MKTMLRTAPQTNSAWLNRNVLLSLLAEERFEILHHADLSFLEEQLSWKDDCTNQHAHECVEEYRKWIALQVATRDPDFVNAYFSGERPPLGMSSRHVDNVWHRHILFTKDYSAFCESIAGEMIHHNPCTRRNVTGMKADATKKAYGILFGPLPKIWIAPEKFLKNTVYSGCGCGCDNRD